MQKNAQATGADGPKDVKLVLGLMSGTSGDGIDLALVRTDGEDFFEPVSSGYFAYDPGFNTDLSAAMADAKGMRDRTARPAGLSDFENQVTQMHREAVRSFLAGLDNGFKEPDLIGFHGQTVWHDPGEGVTVQLGSGEILAAGVDCPVVYDFRAADMAAGGQGAPLVPVFHQLLAKQMGLELPCAFVNIGGVSNITWIGEDGALVAFDSGPGNALIDDFVRDKLGWDMDADGRMAAAGQVDFLALVGLMGNDYFRQPAPKSLDRNAFDISALDGHPVEDAVATLTAFTVETICLGLEQAEQGKGGALKHLIVCGGGQNNPVMMAQLQDALDCKVQRADDAGLDGNAMEAQAFAYLAARSQKGLPITFPGTTGVKDPMSGGVLVRS